MNEKVAFPSLNLVRFHATKVAIVAAFEWDEDTRSRFEDVLDEDDTFFAPRKYKRGGVEFSLVEFAYRTPLPGQANPRDILVVTIEYQHPSTLPPQPVPRELRRDGELLQHLHGLVQLPGIQCEVVFENRALSEDSDAEGMWFPLPTRIFPSRGEDPPVDEIRGIRGVKRRTERGGTDVEYSFTLDRPSNGPVYLSVEFVTLEPLRAETPSRALTRAQAFARTLGVL